VDTCGSIDPGPNSWRPLTKRGLTSETIRKFGYFVGGFKGQSVQVAPYYSQGGELANQKLRLPNKEFVVLSAHEGAEGIAANKLFGQQVFGDKFDRTVVITEGEIDAMAVAQSTDFKIAAVSINTGSKGALKCLKANYLWLDRFKDIVLWFDDDKPGKDAMAECAQLFKVGKVRIAKVAGFKDASALLEEKVPRPGDIKAAVWAASTWRPQGIVNARDSKSAILAPRERSIAYTYPPMMVKLQEMTGGINLGEVIYHVAGTGVGKSAALREIQYNLLIQGVKFGVLSFEDTLRDMQFGIMSIAESERLHLVPVPDPDDEKGMATYDRRMSLVHDKVFGEGQVELFDPERAEWSMEAILKYVRWMAKALDCKVIFIDPLSFVAAGIELSDDERRVLDNIAAQFAMLAKELNVNIQVSHHLRRVGNGVPHEEGAGTALNELRSSGGLANFAMCVVGWERNSQADGDAWRVTQSRIIKPSRRTGQSGLADLLYYGENGRLIKSPIPFPPIGKPKEGGQQQGRAFPVIGGPSDY
jgi:twinkle protein